MTKRIPVTYATRAGSIAGAADFTGAELRCCGLDVDIQPVTAMPTLSA